MYAFDAVGVLEPRLRVEPAKRISRGLRLARFDAELPGKIVPPVGNHVGERLVHQLVGQRGRVAHLTQLEQQTFLHRPSMAFLG